MLCIRMRTAIMIGINALRAEKKVGEQGAHFIAMRGEGKGDIASKMVGTGILPSMGQQVRKAKSLTWGSPYREWEA